MSVTLPNEKSLSPADMIGGALGAAVGVSIDAAMLALTAGTGLYVGTGVGILCSQFVQRVVKSRGWVREPPDFSVAVPGLQAEIEAVEREANCWLERLDLRSKERERLLELLAELKGAFSSLREQHVALAAGIGTASVAQQNLGKCLGLVGAIRQYLSMVSRYHSWNDDEL